MHTRSRSATLVLAGLFTNLSLVSASPIHEGAPISAPVHHRRTASVVSLPPRGEVQHSIEARHESHSSHKVFSAAFAIAQSTRVASKYNKANRRESDAPIHQAGNVVEVDTTSGPAIEVHLSSRSEPFGVTQEPFDIQSVNATNAQANPNAKRTATLKVTSGKEGLVDYNDGIDILYYGPISIGTPAQATTMDFDTGSSDLVMPLSSCNGCNGPMLNTANSRTYVVSKSSFSIEYGDGTGAKGKVATDTVTIAGLTVAGQGFGAITSVSGGFGTQGPNAGLLGMGFPANANSGKTPFFWNLANARSLASNVFGVYLRRNGDSGSELCLGCIDSSKYTGSLTYFSLDKASTYNTQYYWNILSAGLTYNGGTPTGKFSAVLDTGTTLIYVPTAAARAFYAQIPGTAPWSAAPGFYTYPCSASLGTMAIRFGTTNFAINQADFNVGLTAVGSSNCVGGIVGQDISDGSTPLAIVGDEYLKSWYSVFDLTNNRVGFAAAI
ncbi:hypothetical protein FRB98_004029 [Tulasnella sp. 332]|nr:hypothetical protein FRB98_004029 [Tulasnella sp. 332]